MRRSARRCSRHAHLSDLGVQAGRWKRPIGALRTRPSSTVTPSQRSSVSLLVGMRTDDASTGVDDAPPGNLDLGGRQDPSDQAGLLRVARDVGDVAVGGHLALAQGHQHVEDPPLPLDALGRRSPAQVRRFPSAELGEQIEAHPAPGSIVRVPSAISMQWNGYSTPSSPRHRAEALLGVERSNGAATWVTSVEFGHGTILAIGISTRSVAPASRRAGITRLIIFFSTTDSTA